MRTFIQLKDNVGWASVTTTGEIENAIEVEAGTGDFYIKKKYENGVWSEADLITFAEVNNKGDIIEIKRTYFSSEIIGPILESDTTTDSKWINNEWVAPIQPPIINHEIVEENNTELPNL